MYPTLTRCRKQITIHISLANLFSVAVFFDTSSTKGPCPFHTFFSMCDGSLVAWLAKQNWVAFTNVCFTTSVHKSYVSLFFSLYTQNITFSEGRTRDENKDLAYEWQQIWEVRIWTNNKVQIRLSNFDYISWRISYAIRCHSYVPAQRLWGSTVLPIKNILIRLLATGSCPQLRSGLKTTVWTKYWVIHPSHGRNTRSQHSLQHKMEG